VVFPGSARAAGSSCCGVEISVSCFSFIQEAGERQLSAPWGRGKAAGDGEVQGMSLGFSEHHCPHGVCVLTQRSRSTSGFFDGFFTVYLAV